MLPTSDAMRELGARLASPELLVFPVRHHSPACAWQLRRWLAGVRPSAVLVEGPRGFDALIPMLVHPEARMPLAVYSYAVFSSASDRPARRRAAYYPFCDHSPELVALRAAHTLGIPANFIDLDHAEQCLADTVEEGEPSEREGPSLLDERHFERSRHLGALASQLGCRNHEELWEHLFEAPVATRSLQQHLADMATYCQLARDDCSTDELHADGTLAREAEMAWHIRQAVERRGSAAGPVLAVVGGFHAVSLVDLLGRGSVERPAISRRTVVDEGTALIRYGQDRLDRLNGYAAGMTSPAWHQQVWERLLRHDKASLPDGAAVRRELALTMLFDIASELRTRHGLSLPMPALSAGYEHVLQLAALRQRSAPVREDVLDAVRSCFVKGEVDADGALVLTVARRMLTGRNVGQVPPGAGTPPLVRDVERRARRQRLKIDDSAPHRAVLDLYRRPEHRVTSQLFHGLSLLGVPLAQWRAGPDFVNGSGLGRLQEHWTYSYSAATESALVEAAVYGATLPLAVAARFDEHLERLESGGDRRNAKGAAALLAQACVLGLHEHVPKVCGALSRVMAADADFASVAAAAGSIGLLWESREPLAARGLEDLPALLRAAFDRAVYLGLGDSVEGDEVVAGLRRLRELLSSDAGRSLDGPLYWSLVDGLSMHAGSAFIRGAAVGLAFGAGRLSEKDLGVKLEGHLNGLQAPRDAVSFVRGLLDTAREVAWQQPLILEVLDRLLTTWADADFVANLPELRLAFAEMTPNETDRIAQAVSGLRGGPSLGRLVRYDVSAAQVQAHLILSEQLTSVLREDGLDDWARA